MSQPTYVKSSPGRTTRSPQNPPSVSRRSRSRVTFEEEKQLQACQTIQRWYTTEITSEQYEKALFDKHRMFRQYPNNIYILNKAALQIQHWFFKKQANIFCCVIPKHFVDEMCLELQTTGKYSPKSRSPSTSKRIIYNSQLYTLAIPSPKKPVNLQVYDSEGSKSTNFDQACADISPPQPQKLEVTPFTGVELFAGKGKQVAFDLAPQASASEDPVPVPRKSVEAKRARPMTGHSEPSRTLQRPPYARDLRISSPETVPSMDLLAARMGEQPNSTTVAGSSAKLGSVPRKRPGLHGPDTSQSVLGGIGFGNLKGHKQSFSHVQSKLMSPTQSTIRKNQLRGVKEPTVSFRDTQPPPEQFKSAPSGRQTGTHSPRRQTKPIWQSHSTSHLKTPSLPKPLKQTTPISTQLPSSAPNKNIVKKNIMMQSKFKNDQKPLRPPRPTVTPRTSKAQGQPMSPSEALYSEPSVVLSAHQNVQDMNDMMVMRDSPKPPSELVMDLPSDPSRDSAQEAEEQLVPPPASATIQAPEDSTKSDIYNDDVSKDFTPLKASVICHAAMTPPHKDNFSFPESYEVSNQNTTLQTAEKRRDSDSKDQFLESDDKDVRCISDASLRIERSNLANDDVPMRYSPRRPATQANMYEGLVNISDVLYMNQLTEPIMEETDEELREKSRSKGHSKKPTPEKGCHTPKRILKKNPQGRSLQTLRLSAQLGNQTQRSRPCNDPNIVNLRGGLQLKQPIVQNPAGQAPRKTVPAFRPDVGGPAVAPQQPIVLPIPRKTKLSKTINRSSLILNVQPLVWRIPDPHRANFNEHKKDKLESSALLKTYLIDETSSIPSSTNQSGAAGRQRDDPKSKTRRKTRSFHGNGSVQDMSRGSSTFAGSMSSTIEKYVQQRPMQKKNSANAIVQARKVLQNCVHNYKTERNNREPLMQKNHSLTQILGIDDLPESTRSSRQRTDSSHKQNMTILQSDDKVLE